MKLFIGLLTSVILALFGKKQNCTFIKVQGREVKHFYSDNYLFLVQLQFKTERTKFNGWIHTSRN
jgi:hypothetical protein